jgi:hypothetical protein
MSNDIVDSAAPIKHKKSGKDKSKLSDLAVQPEPSQKKEKRKKHKANGALHILFIACSN